MSEHSSIALGHSGESRRVAWCVGVMTLSVLLHVGVSVAEPADQLPDLRPYLPLGALGDVIDIVEDDFEAPSGRALRFESYVHNAGSMPLVIQGRERQGTGVRTRRALQCLPDGSQLGIVGCPIERDAGALQLYEMVDLFDPERCFSFENLVLYELRAVLDGEPDFRPEGLIASTDAAFPLEDDVSWAGASTTTTQHPSCLGWQRQGLTPGFMTRRHLEQRGQYLDIAGRNGTFALVMNVDPLDRLAESDETNNTTWLIVRISGLNVEVIE